MGVAARISKILLYKASGKCFFIKNPNLKQYSGGWEGRGGVWLG